MKLLHILTAVLVAIAIGAFAGPWLGLSRPNVRFLGVPLTYQTQPKPGESYLTALRQVAADHDLEDWTIQSPQLGGTTQTRQCYYRATLVGTKDGKPVEVSVELTAPEGGKWTLTKWSER